MSTEFSEDLKIGIKRIYGDVNIELLEQTFYHMNNVLESVLESKHFTTIEEYWYEVSQLAYHEVTKISKNSDIPGEMMRIRNLDTFYNQFLGIGDLMISDLKYETPYHLQLLKNQFKSMYPNVVKTDNQIQELCKKNILEKSTLGKRPMPIDGGVRAEHSTQSWKMYATAERVILPGKKRESIIYVRRTQNKKGITYGNTKYVKCAQSKTGYKTLTSAVRMKN